MTAPIQRLVTDLHTIPLGMRRELRPRLKNIGERVARDARGRAAWSSRIPGAIKVSTRLAKRAQGVSVRVNKERAPHGRAYEGLSKKNRAGTFRHPVFGAPELWVTQRTRPYLMPAARANDAKTRQAVESALNAAAVRRGFY